MQFELSARGAINTSPPTTIQYTSTEYDVFLHLHFYSSLPNLMSKYIWLFRWHRCLITIKTGDHTDVGTSTMWRLIKDLFQFCMLEKAKGQIVAIENIIIKERRVVCICFLMFKCWFILILFKIYMWRHSYMYNYMQ